MPIHFRNSPVNEPFILDSVGDHWRQDCVFRPKGYPFYHYLQTEKGRGIVRIHETEYLLNEDEGVLTAPFLPHSYEKDTEEWDTAFVSFTGTISGSIDKMLGNRQVIMVGKEQGVNICSMIHDIMEHWDTLSSDTHMLSIKTYSLLMQFTDSLRTRALSDDPLYLRYVAPVIKEIERSFDMELTVQNLSHQVYVTPQYLSRLFRRFLGCSVYEYLTTYRINRAREFLVCEPRTEVQQIARKTGFSDPSHFIFMFKKITGVTPLEFRRLN